MREMPKNQEKLQDKGMKAFEEVLDFLGFQVRTPHTGTLEVWGDIKDKEKLRKKIILYIADEIIGDAMIKALYPFPSHLYN